MSAIGVRGAAKTVHVRAARSMGGVSAKGGIGAVDDVAADVGCQGFATALATKSRLMACLGAPSRSTIAGLAAPSAAAGAMFAIDRAVGTMDRRTQHWPRPSAGTNAPWHTRNASPPGRPPEKSRMAHPVGRAHGHRDDDRAAAPTLGVVRAPSVVLGGGDGREREVARVGGCAHVSDRFLTMRACATPAAPSCSPSPFSSFPPAPSAVVPSSAPPRVHQLCRATDAANASFDDLAGKSTLETVAVLHLPYADDDACGPSAAFRPTPIAGRITAVVGVTVLSSKATRHVETLAIASSRFVPSTVREVHVRSNLDGSSDRRTWTSARLLLVEVHAPILLLLRAIRDAGAGVHVNDVGSRAFHA